MANKDESIPSVQFDRVVFEMRKLEKLFEEIDKGLALSRGIHRFEAVRALDKARSS